jgi:hypothetical protein
MKQIIELKDEIIKLQKELLEKDKIIEKDKEICKINLIQKISYYLYFTRWKTCIRRKFNFNYNI